MAYVGQAVNIPLGQQGLLTDIPRTQIPITALTLANNVRFNVAGIDKAPGSIKFNSTALDSGASIVGLRDWFPEATVQRLFAMTATGKLFRDTGDGSFSSGVAIDSSFGSPTTDFTFVDAGNEDSSQNRKLFMLSNTRQLSYIDGDVAAVTNAVGAADWVTSKGAVTLTAAGNTVDLAAHGLSNGDVVYFTNVTTTTTVDDAQIYFVINANVNDFQISLTSGGSAVTIDADGTANLFDNNTGSFPTGGFLFRDRLICFGNANDPHRLYISGASDHGNFVTGVSTIPVFPGEGDALTEGIVYKGRAFLFKKPTGVYFLDDQGSNTVTDWTIQRVDSGFGIASPHAVIQVLDDLLLGNATGGITSLKATEAFGDVRSGDVLSNARIENFIRQQFDKAGTPFLQSTYYEEKKLAYFSYRGQGSSTQDNLLVIDVNQPTPRFSINSRDPATVLTLRRDADGIKRPIRGTSDGFVFLMDQESIFAVDGSAYTGEFQTSDIDFSELDPTLATRNKNFDFLTLTFTGRSTNPIFAEITIDGKTVETIEFPQVTGAVLDSFVLDADILTELSVDSRRKQLHGSGRRIRIRIFNTTSDEFNIENMQIEFRLGDEGEK